jgi:hypothetical protein
MVLTLLSLVVGYLILSISTALLYGTWLSSGTEQVLTPAFLAFAAVCSLGFATLSGYLTALIAQRAPITHAIALALLLAVIWGISTFTGKPSGPLNLSILHLAMVTIGTLTGGWWRLRQMKARDQALTPK